MIPVPSEVCGFCGERHAMVGELWGMKVVACPNLPDGWTAMGPDADGDMVIHDEGAWSIWRQLHGGEASASESHG